MHPIRAYRTNASFDTTLLPFLQTLLIAAVVCCVGELAFAGSAATPDYCEFNKPLNNFFKIITGPVTTAIAMAGIIACGVALVFGGEMKDFVKMMVTIVIVICAVIGAGGIFKNVFGLEIVGTCA